MRRGTRGHRRRRRTGHRGWGGGSRHGRRSSWPRHRRRWRRGAGRWCCGRSGPSRLGECARAQGDCGNANENRRKANTARKHVHSSSSFGRPGNSTREFGNRSHRLKRFWIAWPGQGAEEGVAGTTRRPIANSAITKLCSKIQKIPLAPSGKSVALICPARACKRGRCASSRNVGAGCDGRCRRQREENLVQTKRPQRTAKSCGPGAATLASSRPRGISSATVAKQAAHRGEHEVSRKAIARGKPGCLGCTCQIRVRSFTTIAHGATGAVGARLSLRPLTRGGPKSLQSSGEIAP